MTKYTCKVKTVYKGQPRGVTKEAFADSWPSFRASETTFRFSRDELRLAFVDRKPLLAGVLMHRFDCILSLSEYYIYQRVLWDCHLCVNVELL